MPFLDNERIQPSLPSAIVIGAGFAGFAAACALKNASFQVIVLGLGDRVGGRVHTDYSFGFPVDMGASWLHGVYNENPLAPLLGRLGLPLYRTSNDNSVLYDHDLESYVLFDTYGNQVPQELVKKVGELFERILEEENKLRDEYNEDMSIARTLSIVIERCPQMKLEGLGYRVMQWYLCRMEGWFASDANAISLKHWDQEVLLPGGHGLMVRGYFPVINTLARDAAVATVPLGVLKANLIKFEPKLPDWKEEAINDDGPIILVVNARASQDIHDFVIGTYHLTYKLSGLKQLRDALALGSQKSSVKRDACFVGSCFKNFEILRGRTSAQNDYKEDANDENKIFDPEICLLQQPLFQ